MAFNKKDTFILEKSMKKLDFSNKVQKIKCPTIIVCGEKDSANIKSAYYLSENIKNAKLKIIENTGHVVNEEKSQILAKVLEQLYKEFQSIKYEKFIFKIIYIKIYLNKIYLKNVIQYILLSFVWYN